MRHLVLLALATLAAFPLAARDHGWREPRRVVVVEESCRPSRRWEEDRWRHRDHGWHRRYDRDDRCDWEDRVVLRPLPRSLTPPFQGRVELWIR